MGQISQQDLGERLAAWYGGGIDAQDRARVYRDGLAKLANVLHGGVAHGPVRLRYLRGGRVASDLAAAPVALRAGGLCDLGAVAQLEND